MTPDDARKATKLPKALSRRRCYAEMAQDHGVDMPIVSAVSAVLDGSMSVG